MIHNRIRDISGQRIQASVLLITPEMACNFLERNKKNRQLSAKQIKLYAAEMKAGDWRLNGEAVIFSHYGDVLDGQHRLWACFESDVAFETLVVEGVDPETFKTIDTGRSRKVKDVLYIEGLAPGIAGIVGSAAAIAISFERSGHIHQTQEMKIHKTHEKLSEWVHQNTHYITLAEKVNSYGRQGKGLRAGETVFLWARMEKIDYEKTQEFFDGFLSGANLEKDDIRLILRRKFEVQAVRGTSWKQSSRMGAVCRAWRAYRFGFSTKNPSNIFSKLEEGIEVLKK